MHTAYRAHLRRPSQKNPEEAKPTSEASLESILGTRTARGMTFKLCGGKKRKKKERKRKKKKKERKKERKKYM